MCNINFELINFAKGESVLEIGMMLFTSIIHQTKHTHWSSSYVVPVYVWMLVYYMTDTRWLQTKVLTLIFAYDIILSITECHTANMKTAVRAFSHPYSPHRVTPKSTKQGLYINWNVFRFCLLPVTLSTGLIIMSLRIPIVLMFFVTCKLGDHQVWVTIRSSFSNAKGAVAWNIPM